MLLNFPPIIQHIFNGYSMNNRYSLKNNSILKLYECQIDIVIGLVND